MTRIHDIFKTLRTAGRGGLMPFVTGGYPSVDVTERVLPAIDEAGADIIEVGIPFSDPIADGPVIAASMHEALVAGATPASVFEAVKRARPNVSAGLIAMVSDSIVRRMGGEAFVSDAADAGFDGLIVPDIDTDGGANSDAGALARLANDRGLTCTFLIAPTTDESRISNVVNLCSGFVYLLARVGITGERDDAPEIEERVNLVREYTDLPIAVGFGISKPEHVRAVVRSADAAIVGSALVRRMGESSEPVSDAAAFVRELAKGVHSETRSAKPV